MAVYFRFRSALNFSHVRIPSHSISSGDLKLRIVQQERLDKEKDDFDLILSYAQSGKGSCRACRCRGGHGADGPTLGRRNPLRL